MKQTYKHAAAWLIAAALLSCCVCGAAEPLEQEPPQVSAVSALVLDCTGNRVLYEKNADASSLIASTTKIMTALVAAERCNLENRVRVPAEAAGIEGSSMYLKAGEVLTVRDLLCGLLLKSGNDAAVALAIHCAGDVGAFVSLMNEKAAELGLEHTHFSNPNGLDDDNNRSTARDLAQLARAALENKTVAELCATKTASAAGRQFTNHNKLLWRYPGAIGVKTGYTKAAGRILVSAAQRDGRRLVAVTISAPDDWNDHEKLLDYGFSAFGLQTVVTAGETLAECALLGGAQPTAPIAAKTDFDCALLPGEKPELRLTLPGMTNAPVKAGEPAGWADVYVEDTCLGRVALIWAQTVERRPPKTGLAGLWDAIW